MSETVSFPGLGLEFDVQRTAFTMPEFLGGWSVYWYGVLIALGLLAGVLYFFARAKEFAVDPDRATDVLLVAIICAVIGARLYFVAFTWDDYKNDLLSILNIRKGGLAIYGCVIGAFLSGWIMCKVKKIPFLPLVDLATGGLFIGQAIGRWGNFVNVEAFGSNTTAPWGMTSPTVVWYLTQQKDALAAIGVTVDPNMPVHPTFFYESMWCLLGFLFVVWFTKRRRFDGQITLIYLGWYGLGRFFIEGLRTDSLLMGTIRVSRLLALLCFIAASAAMIIILSRIRREGDPEYLRLFRDTEEGQRVIAASGGRLDKERMAMEPDSARLGDHPTKEPDMDERDGEDPDDHEPGLPEEDDGAGDDPSGADDGDYGSDDGSSEADDGGDGGEDDGGSD